MNKDKIIAIFLALNIVVFWISIIALALVNVISIGYGLYLWGSVGLLFKVSVWKAFIFWSTYILLFLGTMLVSLGIMKITE